MANPEPATQTLDPTSTEVGSVFVSNYPPYSQWTPEAVEEVHRVLDQPPRPGVPLGLYMHIPFCRRRCKFCYFRVFTDRNSDQIQGYIDALIAEAAMYKDRAALAGRPVDFVYFGGGTPSYISVKHLEQLVAGVQESLPWDQAREIAFECEPGTLTRSKLEAIRGIGVTRLSLGVENFDDEILKENGRAHVTKEIDRVLPWVAELDFPQLNIDLIAGMVGETWETWKHTIDRTLEVSPDSVTIYQMELPYNTVYSKQVLEGGDGPPIANWELKREWQAYAFERLAENGYRVSSAYTMVKEGCHDPFVYRDSLWQGADLLPLGVSSFGHLSGVHFQNESGWTPYLERVEQGELPVSRAFVPSEDEKLTREVILQLKRGWLDRRPFQEKFGVDIRERFLQPLAELQEENLLDIEGDRIELRRPGLLRVDTLLPKFYAPEYRGARYT
ncbi:MAG: coproporphyrinogen-III oxidase family protein [Acidobacteriota bacterium]|nr:coproporphyrinogen-III oxidase family protein [Acidobacteriota bacterium]